MMLSLTMVAGCLTAAWAQDAKDTEKAAKTRSLLKTKISVDWKDTLVQDVARELSEKVKDASGKEFPTKVDNVSGLSNNQKITFAAKDKSVADLLDELGKKEGIGYIVINGKYKTYTKFDGYLLLTKGTERGSPDKGK
jgi:hypothetical protein